MSKNFLCPVDQTALIMSERQGVEIDYCPTCRGVWLDRGELDKIIEKDAAQAVPTARQQADPGSAVPRHSGDYGYERKPHKRRKSFLEELFD